VQYAVSKMNSINKDVLDQLLAIGSSDRSKLKNASLSKCPEIAEPTGDLSAKIEAEIVDLFHQHAASLGRYAESLTRDRELAQDAIQEIFLRYFKMRSDGDDVENARAWLFRVLRNYLLDHIRKQNLIKPVELDVLGNMADSKQNTEAKYERNEVFRLAVAALTPREQECIQLRLEGFDYEEIAQILQIRARSVGALLTRSLNKIRRTGLFSGRQ
jgi:RNA polymerase sigma factor (sigma-70 family)